MKEEEVKITEQETVQPEKKQETKKVKNIKNENHEHVVYIGPSVKGKLKNGTAYTRGIPKILEKMIQKEPAMKKMFVPISEIAEAQKQISDENSALNIIYKKIEGVVQNGI